MMLDLTDEKNVNDVRFLLDRAMQEPIFSEFAVDAISLLYSENEPKEPEEIKLLKSMLPEE